MKKPVWNAVVFTALLGAAMPIAFAQTTDVYTAEDSMKDSLRALEGKQVTIRLKNGQRVKGRLAALGQQLVHIQPVAGREYYAEVLLIDQVAGVEYRAK